MTTEDQISHLLTQYGKSVENRTLASLYLLLRDKGIREITVEELAERFGKTRTMIYRAIDRVKAEQTNHDRNV